VKELKAGELHKAILSFARSLGDHFGLGYDNSKKHNETVGLVELERLTTTILCHVLEVNKHPHMFFVTKSTLKHVPQEVKAFAHE